jgi:hypothetical protein
MAGEQELLALAQLAGKTLVAAVATDAWGKAKAGLARLLGHGDDRKTEAAERRLDDTRALLTEASHTDLEGVRATQAAVWEARLSDVLEDYPDLEADLRDLIAGIAAQLPAGLVAPSGHAVAAGRDVTITASGGGVAAGTIQGSVSAGNPPAPGAASK